jgi:hypothetical protein
MGSKMELSDRSIPAVHRARYEHNGLSDRGNYAIRFLGKCNVHHRFKAHVRVVS